MWTRFIFDPACLDFVKKFQPLYAIILKCVALNFDKVPNSILVFFCRFQAINFMNSHLNVYASDKYNEKKTKPVGQNLFRER